MTRKILSVFVVWILFCSVAWAEGKVPFVGEVTGETVNVRAGQNTNFEKLCTLPKGSQVVVVEKSFTWYKVRLPLDAKCFISKDYIQMLDSSMGVVTGSRVNLRAAANTNATAIGQLTKDSMVKIVAQLEDWYQIEPVDGTYGWIAEQFLVFKSDKVPAAQPVTQLAKAKEAVPVVPEPAPPVAVVPPKEKKKDVVAFSSTGRIEPLEGASEGVVHKLIMDDNDVYYLQAPAYTLNQFLYSKVEVKGALRNDPALFRPVVVVSKIQLVL